MTKPNKHYGVQFAPDIQRSLMQGIDILCEPLAVTLGPLGRTVMVAPFNKIKKENNAPEILTDAGTIARRIVEIPDRRINAGAMLLRSMSWSMRDQVGDGSATAAVLARALVHSCLRMVSAGIQPTLLREGLQQGVRIVNDCLNSISRPIHSQKEIYLLAQSVTQDTTMSSLIAEIFDIVGEDGPIVIEEYVATFMDREYVEGVYWESGLVSSQFVTDPVKQEAAVTNPYIALTDLDIATSDQIVPLLNHALQCHAESLVIIAPKIEGEALGTLLLNKSKIPTLALNAPGLILSQTEIIKDLAVLTGATVVDSSAGMKIENFRAEYFGKARRVLASTRRFTIVGVQGSPKEIRKRNEELKQRIASQETMDQNIARRRLANLSGGVAILKIGAVSEIQRQLKVQLAEDAIRAVRSALKEGVVPGGGAGYLACIPAVKMAAKETTDREKAAGLLAIAEALKTPLTQIASNAGYDGRVEVARVLQAGPEYGFNALTGKIVNMYEYSIVDSILVTRLALEKAASMAAMYVTTGAFVVPKNPISVKGRI